MQNIRIKLADPMNVNPISSVALEVDLPSPQLANSLINLSASSSSAGSIEYQFQVKNLLIQNEWITLRDYAENSAYLWDTSAYQGKNILRVLARKAGSQDKVVKDTQTFWINDLLAVTSVDLTPDLLSPQTSGETITFNSNIVGGNGSEEYQFYVKEGNLEAEWQISQSWSSSNSYVWTTQNKYGKYRIKVHARNSGSIDKEAIAKHTFWLNAPNSLASVDLNRDLISPQISGVIVNFTAIPSDTIGTNEFQFEIKTNGGDWSIIQPYSSNAEFALNTQLFTGKNVIRVKAKREGTVDKIVKDKKVIWVNQSNPITSVTISSNGNEFNYGDSLILDTLLTDGDFSGDIYYYKLDVKKKGQPYVIDQTYGIQSITDPISWNVGNVTTGDYKVRIRVVDVRTDKPVKSNSVSISINSSSGGGIGTGDGSGDQGDTCSIYEACFCELLLNCSDDYQAPNGPAL